VKRVEFVCVCGKLASATYSDDDNDTDTEVALAHDLPTCKNFDTITDVDSGADYIRDCREAIMGRMN
jgi:hypothetical protein